MANSRMNRFTRDTSPAASTSSNADDLGFGNRITNSRDRFVNKDGSFNIIRQMNRGVFDLNTYQWLILIRWSKFIFVTLMTYFVVNCLFAGIYMMLGVEQIAGVQLGSALQNFTQAYFFSAQTLTTVGYGGMHPTGFWCSTVASLEAITGLMMFAIVTGLLFARFSRPSTKVRFSENILLSPFEGGTAVMMRLANCRRNILLDLQAQMTISWTDTLEDGSTTRRFYIMPLERNVIAMLPLNWTLVHALNEDSMLFNWTRDDFERRDAEILVSLKAFDDTFAQTVRANTSYKWTEVIENARFLPMFYTNESGHVVLEIDKINDYSAAGAAS